MGGGGFVQSGRKELVVEPLLSSRLSVRLHKRILRRVTSAARRAILVIRECVATDRYALAVHFGERMAERGLYWPDVQAVIDDPRDVRAQGMDRYGRPKWIISGETATADEIEVVCAVEVDETETEFITIYWED